MDRRVPRGRAGLAGARCPVHGGGPLAHGGPVGTRGAAHWRVRAARSTEECGWVRRPALGHVAVSGWGAHGAQSTGTRDRVYGLGRATWLPRSG